MAIVMGLPSKGRMKEDALAVLTRAGLDPVADGDARGYRASLAAMPEVEIAFLTAGEIARELATGGLDLGITGEDLMREAAADLDERVVFEKRLGFGQADVVVAVPDIWLDVTDMADLDDVASHFRQTHQRRLRIATKYWRLTHDFFSAQHGIQVYSIVESLGATEGAPAAGLADIIVDITSTGATLKANRLKMLADGLILQSQACLIASKREMDAHEEAVRAKLLQAIGCRGN